MAILLLILAIVFFVGGIIFILTGTNHGPEETPSPETLIQVSAIEEHKNKILQLEKELSASVQGQKQVSLERDELQKHSEETKAQLEKFDLNVQQLIKETSSQVGAENENLKKQNEELILKINALEKESISLKKTVEESSQRHQQNSGVAEQLSQANKDLLDQLKKYEENNLQLQSSLEVLKTSNEQKEQLQREKDELSRNKTTLELNFNKLTEMNKFFTEEGKILREELIKSHAQVMGLEKICAEFKNQQDQMDKVVEKVN